MRSVTRLVLLVGLLLVVAPLRAAETPVLAILPFEVTSPQRVDYLRETLVHLLADRITERSGATVVAPRRVVEALRGQAGRALTDQEARDLGRSFGAHYILSGRFTMVGEGFRLDSRLLEVATDREIERLTVNGESVASLMPRLGELAEALAKHFPAAPRTALRPDPRPAAPSGPGPALPSVGFPTPPATPAPPAPAVGPGTSWVSRRLPFEIRGIGVGDVDGDGTSEIVVLAKNEVHVYRREANELTPLARYQLGGALDGLGIDLADLDGNGAAEIYVTALGSGGALASLVVEWAGSGLRPVEIGIPWYLRVVNLAGSPVLVGQRRASDKAFDGPIRRLVWQRGKLVPGDPLGLPGHVTVYSFAVADLDGDGRPEIVSSQPRSPLTLYNADGKVAGRGAAYGQTALYVTAKRGAYAELEEGAYLPGRVVAVHLPGQGTGLLVSRNYEAFPVFARARTFRSGEIVGLRWETNAVDEIWQSQQLAYVADFQVGPLERGREPSLVVGVVSDFGGVFASPASYVMVLPLRAAFGR